MQQEELAALNTRLTDCSAAANTTTAVPQPADLETVGCELCGCGEDDESMLLCDACERGFHMGCLKPPLQQVPAGEWLCDSCAQNRTALSTDAQRICYSHEFVGTAAVSLAPKSTKRARDGKFTQPPPKPAVSKKRARKHLPTQWDGGFASDDESEDESDESEDEEDESEDGEADSGAFKRKVTGPMTDRYGFRNRKEPVNYEDKTDEEDVEEDRVEDASQKATKNGMFPAEQRARAQLEADRTARAQRYEQVEAVGGVVPSDATTDRKRAHPSEELSEVEVEQSVEEDESGAEAAEFRVERIVDERGEGGSTEYLVKWDGFATDENTWEPPETLASTAALEIWECDIDIVAHLARKELEGSSSE